MNISFLYIVLIGFFLISCSSNEITQKRKTNNEMFGENSTVKNKNLTNDIVNLKLEELHIKLTPFVAESSKLPDASLLLKDRLNSTIVKVGYGGLDSNPRFVIGPSVSLLSQNIMSTAPTNYMNTYEINFFIVDVATKTIFNSYKIEFKGVGFSSEKALINGLRGMDLEKQEFFDFLKKGEDKILKFYEENCSSIIQNAETEAVENKYDNAFALLSSIPTECKSCFKKVKAIKQKYFKASLNNRCNQLLMSMKSELGKFNDFTGSGFNEEAMSYYAMIDKKASCYKEAQIVYKNYIKHLKPKQKSDVELKIKKFEKIKNALEENDLSTKKLSQNQIFKLKMIEMQSKIEIEGNKKLLAKYKYDESPWLIKVCSSFVKLFKGELKTS